MILSTVRMDAALSLGITLLLRHNVITLDSLDAPLTVLPLRSFQS